jgi:hypothetical protein
MRQVRSDLAAASDSHLHLYLNLACPVRIFRHDDFACHGLKPILGGLEIVRSLRDCGKLESSAGIRNNPANSPIRVANLEEHFSAWLTISEEESVPFDGADTKRTRKDSLSSTTMCSIAAFVNPL